MLKFCSRFKSSFLLRVPLHAAAWSDSSDCLQTLLDRDADVNMADLSGQTPAIMAAQRGHQMLLGWCFKLLVEDLYMSLI